MEEPIRLLLVDDHSVIREGLRILLGQHPCFAIAGEANDGGGALDFLAQHAVDVVVLDMKMPGTATIDVISAIKRLHPESRILVFTSYAQDSQVRDALEAGATGYLLKDTMQHDLVRAIREVAAGRAWLHPQAQQQMLEWMRKPPSPIDFLTPRERSVLIAIADGLTNKEIARRLQLTEGTVKGYVSLVLEKLGVPDRTQAALLAHKLGPIPEARRRAW